MLVKIRIWGASTLQCEVAEISKKVRRWIWLKRRIDQLGKRTKLHENVETEESAGDVRTGYACKSGVWRWKAGVVSNGDPWWNSVAHSLDAEVVVAVIKKTLNPDLLSRLLETHVLIAAEGTIKGERNNADAEKAMPMVLYKQVV